MLLSLVFGAGLLSASATASAAKDIFVLEDPRGDDFGAGDLVYPNSGVIERGTLDLVSLRAYADKDGTWFRARMARRIASPKGLTTYIGKEPLDNLARHGFFTFNIDIYIDQDRVAGSGRVDTLPGRKVEVAFEDAWEKTVVLTPRPEVARAYYKLHLESQAEDTLRAEFGKVTAEQLREAQDRVEAQLTEAFLFPNRIRVRGSREIEFFVPDSFLGGPASPDWSYSVLVTGCEVEQLSKVVNLTPGEFSLMVIPAAFGRQSDRFGIVNDGDINQPPVIDLLASSVAQQQRALSDYNVVEQRLAAVPGISPAGVGSVAGLQRPPGAPGQAGSVARPSPGPGSVPTPAPPTPRVDGVAPAAVSPTPSDPGRRTIPDRLRTLNALRDDGLVTEQEYQALRRKILAEL
jgi:hypothetical protein